MKHIAIALLGCALLAASPAIGAPASAARFAEADARLPSGSVALAALDPYLVAPSHLGNIGLAGFLAGNPNLKTYGASNIAADGASAAIILLQTSSLSSVTFTVNGGGVTLLPYSDTFLTKAPSAGSATLTVSGSSFIHAGAYYYAPALVQGPLGGYTTANAITVQATQDAANAQLGLTLVVPPLVLAHGLWGDRTSLSNVEQYIDAVAPWQSQQQLVVPICYSLYLGFDAKKDPLSNGKNPCEVTSRASLQTEIDALLAVLDSEHTVGGRVDLVAHSMGGLAARNYASQSTYASLRNRMQGQFHTIVTLDSPETGSLLANYLIAHRSNTEQAPPWTFNFYVWEGVCGSADVESCFYANSYPLSALTLPIQTGGVYSLEPNGPSLKNPKLVGPNIAHATWRAVSATAPGNSALALGLNTLIGALYFDPNSAPTLNTLLQNLPNDAIVTVASQTKSASQFYTFPDLSHTSLVSSILTWLSGQNVNDNSVVDDPSAKVYQLTACWLATTGSSACKPTEAFGNGGNETAQAPPLRSVKFVNRIDARLPATAVLGSPVTVAIRLLTPDSISHLSVYQQGETGRTKPEEVAITRVENRTAYARITPKLLGPVTVGIRADFGDGAASVQQVNFYAAPPKYPPPFSFKANDLPVLVLTQDGVTHEAMPHPLAIYGAPVGRIYLNSRFVTYNLLRPRGTHAIALQPNGSMRALAPGEAMVEAHFGSSVDRLRVIVRATQQ